MWVECSSNCIQLKDAEQLGVHVPMSPHVSSAPTKEQLQAMLDCLIPLHIMIIYQITISYEICIYSIYIIYIGQCHFDQKHSDQVGTLSFCQSLDRTRAWVTTICRIEPPSINQNIHPIQATLCYKIWVEWSTCLHHCISQMHQIPCLLPLAPYRPYRLHVLPPRNPTFPCCTWIWCQSRMKSWLAERLLVICQRTSCEDMHEMQKGLKGPFTASSTGRVVQISGRASQGEVWKGLSNFLNDLLLSSCVAT